MEATHTYVLVGDVWMDRNMNPKRLVSEYEVCRDGNINAIAQLYGFQKAMLLARAFGSA